MGRMYQALCANKAVPTSAAGVAPAAPRRRRNNPPQPPANYYQAPAPGPQEKPNGYQNQQPHTLSYAAVAQGLKPKNPPSTNGEYYHHPPPSYSVHQGAAPPVNHLPQQQHPPMVYMPPQQTPPNGYFHQVPQPVYQMQQMPQMEHMAPQAMVMIAPGHFLPGQMHCSPPNFFPPPKVMPPPGFEGQIAVYTGQPLITQYDAFGPSPSFVNCSFNQHIALDRPMYPPIPMQPFPLFVPSEKMTNKRRPKAVAIIDPVTGADKLNEIYGPKRKMETEEASPEK